MSSEWTSEAGGTFITCATCLYLSWRRALPLVNRLYTSKPCPLIRRSTKRHTMHSLNAVKMCMCKRLGSFYVTGVGWGIFIVLSRSYSPTSTYITIPISLSDPATNLKTSECVGFMSQWAPWSLSVKLTKSDLPIPVNGALVNWLARRTLWCIDCLILHVWTI